jgi:hypothetical protein
MSVLVWFGLAWFGLAWLVVSSVAGAVIGTALRLADHREQVLHSAPVPQTVHAGVPDRR